MKRPAKIFESNDPLDIIQIAHRYFADILQERMQVEQEFGMDEYHKKLDAALAPLFADMILCTQSKNVLEEELKLIEPFTELLPPQHASHINVRKKSILSALSNREDYNMTSNFLVLLHPELWFDFSRWNTMDELNKAIYNHLKYFDCLDDWKLEESGKFEPNKVLDETSLKLISKMNIPLQELIEKWDRENKGSLY